MFASARLTPLFCGNSMRAVSRRNFRQPPPRKPPSKDQSVLPPDKGYFPTFVNRPTSHLWKPLVFTVGFSGCCYAGAAIWHYERHRSLHDYLYNAKRWGYEQKKKAGEYRQEINKFWSQFTTGQKTIVTLIGVNTFVFLCWKLVSRPFMYRYFTSSFHGDKLYSPMILSAFSHAQALHLFLNMYVLWSFCPQAIDKIFGLEQFVGFYFSAATVSSMFSYAVKALSGIQARSLGASGAVLALIIYFCCKFPDSRLQIIFLPFFNFSGTQAVIGIISLDAVGLLLGWRFFDHAAHLGGSLFGLWYCLYGEKLFWEHRGWIVKQWVDLTGRK